jgi:hypothetical protein
MDIDHAHSSSIGIVPAPDVINRLGQNGKKLGGQGIARTGLSDLAPSTVRVPDVSGCFQRFASFIEDVDTVEAVVLRGSKCSFSVPGNLSEAYWQSWKDRDLPCINNLSMDRRS